jgi:mannose-1-phosphate guanylyltransferase
MNAVILAAGKGERLLPLTGFRPKPLFPLVNRPMLDILILQLREWGVNRICMNLHHLHEEITTHLARHWKGRIDWELVREEALLGTGGGIAHFRSVMTGEPFFLIHNSDVISAVDMEDVIRYHNCHEAVLTLVLKDHPPVNTVMLDANDNVTGIMKDDATESPSPVRRFTYTGIAVAATRIFDFLVPGTPSALADVIIHVLDDHSSSSSRGSVKGYVLQENEYWCDIGTPCSYWKVHHDILVERSILPLGIGMIRDEIVIGRNARIPEETIFRGFTCIGSDCVIEKRVVLENCIVWEENFLGEGFEGKNAIIGPEGCIVSI